MKITFYQKKIASPIGDSEKTKLSKEKSDFLLLPQRSLLDSPTDITKGINQYDKVLNRVLDLTENYKGVVLGGTLYRKDSGKSLESVPITQELNLIDHYDITMPSEKGLSVGDSEIAFIMAGVRFSILAGKDLENAKLLEDISQKGIGIIFYFDGIPQSRSYEEDLEFFSELAKTKNWNIFRICGHDVANGIFGRSLVATPTGIQWKVGKMEEDKDIIKTIHFAQANPFL
ncbi:MAG: amidohydrolase [Leptospira sp.]|nr:amidohydrolase [Leptospira sp.]